MQGLLGAEEVESIAEDLVDFWEPESTLRRFDLFYFEDLFADSDLYSLLVDVKGIERNLVSSILGMTSVGLPSRLCTLRADEMLAIYGSLRESSL